MALAAREKGARALGFEVSRTGVAQETGNADEMDLQEIRLRDVGRQVQYTKGDVTRGWRGREGKRGERGDSGHRTVELGKLDESWGLMAKREFLGMEFARSGATPAADWRGDGRPARYKNGRRECQGGERDRHRAEKSDKNCDAHMYEVYVLYITYKYIKIY